MLNDLIPSRMLFRFAVPCRYHAEPWEDSGAALDAGYRIPDLGSLEGKPSPAELYAAWNESGLVFRVIVSGKDQPPWCRHTRPVDSDGIGLWIDTRDVRNVHRATRFCHRYLVLPTGDGAREDEPYVALVPIGRAQETPHPRRPNAVHAVSELREDGYRLDVFIESDALTGYDPQEHSRLGFTAALVDRELGTHTFTVGDPFPYAQDPSLWATLELAGK